MSRKLFAVFVCTGLLTVVAPSALGQGVCDGVSVINNTALESVTVATGVTGRPLYVTAPPVDTGRIFIVAQDGIIFLKKRGDDPATVSTFMDITDRVFASTFENESGLLGLAFDPDYDTNGFFYVSYTVSDNALFCNNCQTIVSRFQVSGADPDLGDNTTELELMRIPQPQGNHNGGELLFGPDGFLYFFTGDGGGSGDDDAGHGVCGNGQNLETTHGKILRVDVRDVDPFGTSPDTGCLLGFVGANYTVPTGNPFVDGSGGNCDEVFAYGIRNAWRNAFDSATGDLYIADVGQQCWEEVNYVPAAELGGQNFGWRQMEGNHCFDPLNSGNCDPANVACTGSPDCNDPSFTDPVLEFSHAGGACSITGGPLYRGCRMSNFQGTYFYGDFCAGFVRSFEISGGAPINEQDWTSQLDPTASLTNSLTSFGVDAQGEMYIVDRGGDILKITAPFTDFQVSGEGAQPFRLARGGDWSWEDLEFSSMHPVDFYRVYRGVPNGVFECIHSTRETTWFGGDPATPAVGELFAYVVTAVNAAGDETRSGGPERTLTNPCPPPSP